MTEAEIINLMDAAGIKHQLRTYWHKYDLTDIDTAIRTYGINDPRITYAVLRFVLVNSKDPTVEHVHHSGHHRTPLQAYQHSWECYLGETEL